MNLLNVVYLLCCFCLFPCHSSIKTSKENKKNYPGIGKTLETTSLSLMGEPRVEEVRPDIPKPKMALQRLDVPQKNSLISSQPSSPVALSKGSGVKYNCLCSPTTHAGSFRCRLHRNNMSRNSKSVGSKLNELAGDT